MRPIPIALRNKIAANPFMQRCVHKAHTGCNGCEGPIQWEHAFCYENRQINEEWNIIPCCRKHNAGVSGEEKEFNRYIALERATLSDLNAMFPKRDWQQEYERLKYKFSYTPSNIFNNDTIFQ